MTILTINRKEFEKKVGKLTKELENRISMFGTPVEEVSDSELSVEVFPNRPDLLSAENFARAIGQFVGKRKVGGFKVNKPEKDYFMMVDKIVKGVRPFTACAVVKGLKFDDAKIKRVIDMQEKLHGSYGRNRKKLALGIYPLEEITFPLKYTARKPDEIKFLALEAKSEMTGRQILSRHPTGREYGHLLKGCELFPIYQDSAGEILSMPPIINSHKTGKITEKTKEVFIECSGFNKEYLRKTINIVVSSFAEMGGKVYAMDVKDSKDGNFVSPDMSPEEMSFKIEDIEKTLGIKLSEKDVRNYLARMGIATRESRRGGRRKVAGERWMIALVPAYRADILHWVDLAEEVAIAYGYDKFEPEIPAISTIAEENPVDKMKRVVDNVLAGLGFLECSSFHLTTKKDVKKMHYNFNDFVEVENSKTGRDVLRIDLLTGLLQIVSENSDASYPQRTFEMGRVFRKSSEMTDDRKQITETGVVEEERLAVALADESVSFTDMKQVLDYFFKMLGVEYSIEAVDDSNYIIGRCGRIIVNRKDIGRIGEIAPRVLKNWKIKMPVVACEIGIEFLG